MTELNKQDVYDYLRQIPKGKVVTYGMIASHLGNKNWARAVGNILHENPDGTTYPCYKVVSSTGKLAEKYAFGGQDRQRVLLEAEGIEVVNHQVDLEQYKWSSPEE